MRPRFQRPGRRVLLGSGRLRRHPKRAALPRRRRWLYRGNASGWRGVMMGISWRRWTKRKWWKGRCSLPLTRCARGGGGWYYCTKSFASTSFQWLASVGRHHQGTAIAGMIGSVEPVGRPAVVGQEEASEAIDGEAVVEDAVFGKRRDDEPLRFFPGAVGRFSADAPGWRGWPAGWGSVALRQTRQARWSVSSASHTRPM